MHKVTHADQNTLNGNIPEELMRHARAGVPICSEQRTELEFASPRPPAAGSPSRAEPRETRPRGATRRSMRPPRLFETLSSPVEAAVGAGPSGVALCAVHRSSPAGSWTHKSPSVFKREGERRGGKGAKFRARAGASRRPKPHPRARCQELALKGRGGAEDGR